MHRQDKAHDSSPLFRAVVRPLQRFFELEAASGILLFAAAVASLLWANLDADSYQVVFETHLGSGALSFTPHQLISDGLMTLFFFLVGMEIKRELLFGELRTLGRAALPAVAALGGMLFPALIYLAFNPAGAARQGWGIPMATDIAFCIGVLTLLRSRVPQGLLVFVTALAIFDDIGGILVIALFYGQGLHLPWLLATGLAAAALFIAGQRQVSSALFYAIGGVSLWLAMHHSGIHATIAGVVLGLAIPGGARGSPSRATPEDSPLARFIEGLHPYVAFLIMPAFALANSGVSLGNVTAAALSAGVTVGTAAGLLFGKLVGIFSFTLIAVRLRLAPMPGGSTRTKLLGASVVSGIGFTVALFIAALAFQHDARMLAQAKLGILAGSLAAGVIGAAILRATAPATSPDPPSTGAR